MSSLFFTRNILFGMGSIKLFPTLDYTSAVKFMLSEAQTRATIEGLSEEEAFKLNIKERMLGQTMGFFFLVGCMVLVLTSALMGYEWISIGFSVLQLFVYIFAVRYESKEKYDFLRNVKNSS